MTRALCLDCGSIKWGALNPCPKCKSQSTGNPNLDIAFSDHVTSSATLEDLGKIIQGINAHEEVSQDVRRWAFLAYVTERCPQILKADPPESLKSQVDEFYDSLDLPAVEWKPGRKISSRTARRPSKSPFSLF